VAKNFVAGILLLVQQPFDIGEVIETSEYAGTVLDISLRATEMRTFDGRYVFIPNADVFVNPLINYSRAPRRRINLQVGVATDADLEQVSRVALEAVRSLPAVLEDPPPQVVFSEFGASSMDFTLYYWIDTEQAGTYEATDAGVKALYSAFAREGIECPYPTYRILGPEGALSG
jgi:small-conductance mechanosensitive channel